MTELIKCNYAIEEWKVACYERLSSSDESDTESNSIENQHIFATV